MARPTLPASAGSSDLAARSSVKAPRGGTFAALAVPFYGRLWMSGWLWNLTRWMGVFLGSYLVTQLTGSPILVQLVGAAFFAPMFFAGALGGVISDRFDRRRTILAQLLILIPIAVGMSLIVIGGGVRVWMIYPFMLAIGLGGVIDMTSRRALVWDFVGEERVTNALALESLSMTGGNMLGSLVGGAVINFIGTGQAFMVIAVCYVGS
ncbi:MAG: MFS transporter, partial [Dehalococcoidia bacterium]